MVMTRAFFRAAILALLVAFSPAILHAQNSTAGKQEIRERALERFSNADFEYALADFRSLMRDFPRDPLYRYYSGICLVKLNRDLKDAVELLYYASDRGVPEDVYYYLGEAYRKMYDFDNAKKFFLEFDRNAPRSMTREMDSKLLIRSADQAKILTSMYNPYEVLAVTFMDLDDPEEYEQIVMKGGKLTRKPNALFSENEEKEGLTSLMFLPDKPARGEYFYFAGYERGGRDGSQIFRVKRSPTGKWTDIETVDALCTDGNEILPYFDPVGSDIYFASDGREGIGGFDLYSAHYDEERDEWSEPRNLGFPINSTYDDYLLLPGADLGMVAFFTGRQVMDDAVAVYRVHLSEPKVSLASESPGEIARIASLDGVAAEAKKEIETYQAMAGGQKAEGDYTEPEVTDEAIAGAEVLGAYESSGSFDEKEERVPADRSPAEVDAVYQALVAKALAYQVTADSLTELATDARVTIRDSEDPNDRWMYQKQIMVWERNAVEAQDAADRLYEQIASYQPPSEGIAVASAVPETIEADTVIDGMTVYRFTDHGEQTTEGQSVSGVPGNPVKGYFSDRTKVESVPEERPSDLQSFSVSGDSPYSSANPIPVDPELPGGAFYRIQLAVFSKPVDSGTFGGISPITGETLPDRGLIRYYAGTFDRFEAAEKALQQVRREGYGDAFIVAWYNGTKMSADRVRKLEK